MTVNTVRFAAIAICLGSVAFGEPPFYTVSTFEVPGAQFTYPRGVNIVGQICGYYTAPGKNASHAFVRDAAGTVTVFDVPGAATTLAFGINDQGQVVGQWSPDLSGSLQHGFVRDLSGAITSFDAPDSEVTGAYGINDGGQMTINALKEPGPYRSFLRNADGSYSGIAVSFLQGLNNNGAAVGAVHTSYAISEGFEVSLSGNVLLFSVPYSTGVTAAYGINDDNVIVGSYNNGVGYLQQTHGFIRETGGSFVSFDVRGAVGTVLYGINDIRRIVETYNDTAGIHGFVATQQRNQRPQEEVSGAAVITPDRRPVLR